MSTKSNGEWEVVGNYVAPSCPDKGTQYPENRVALLGRQADFECLILGRLGMSAKVIAQFTGLRVGQVHYRCQKAGFRISDFRNGHGAYAALVLSKVSAQAARMVTQDVRLLEHE